MVTLFESFILLFVEVDRFFIYLNMNKLLDERKLNILVDLLRMWNVPKILLNRIVQ